MSSDTVPRAAVPHAPRTVERSGRTPSEAVRTWSVVYGGRDVRFAPTDRFAFRHRTVRHHNVALLSSAVSTAAAASFTPDGTPVLAWSAAGGLRVDGGAPTRPGVPVLLPTDRRFTVVAPAGTVQVLRVDGGFLDAVNGVVFDHRYTGRLRTLPSEAEVPQLLARIDAVAVNALHPDRNPGGHLSAQVLLAETVLRAFGGAVVEQDAPQVSRTANTVHLAQAWLAEHCDRPLQLADVCGAVGVSSRTLQENFVQHLGVSPMTYLLLVRLDRVRIALQLADCTQTTVAEVAHRWGFRHMGRFSSTYFQRFDEYPKKTLHTST
ncbi:helix-turn-helix transcriptional regulator [Curtobacterium aurantiacum]|uniref:Helix-turn-helix transcriptional regulator n=1 Tax=Curtobacterium aurantiacum TaxID=3236919 RepID=A0ABS5VGK0_9MICO|nr:helix-turn-helix transcriptional regulator [Curtobacterium flaccumfaciens]MBT1545561.1 helix-turn-helix transcriptional regulator [Curtobacterium flaccumfaciens pv. flaccumfaciens]MBT1588611.1 helix-turn-helix transcriptional regulator [Curtobacterium flaccumfaciens pv. flaccumfaciens]